jgi:mono/diheme cytochrome c family protein
MIRSAGIVLFTVGAASAALAQGAAKPDLTKPDLTMGRQHFEQSCGVCHTKPLITSGRFGPALSKESLGGQADVMAEVIGNGVPLRMPGFKHQLNKDQILAVVAYIQTLDPPPPDAAKPTARTSGERRDDN